ncbi:sensor histidine kinase [Ferruginibacter sp.]
MSQKVHDTVANGLYRMMSEIEYTEKIDKEPLLDKIELLYEKSRDLSYEGVATENNTVERIRQLLISFAIPTTKVSIVGNQNELWSTISPIIVKELEQVLQELMINMKKHSGAHHVIVHFSITNDKLKILYKDERSWFPSKYQKREWFNKYGKPY